jgi:hypothetical protein
MRSQEQAFRAYYASMTDAELLQIAANERSFLAVAQKTLDGELAKRRLTPAAPAVPPPRHSVWGAWGDHLAKWARRLHHHPASP